MLYGVGSYIKDGTLYNDDGTIFSTSATVTASAPVAGCPANADAWQSKQNGYCADEYGWPLRPDGSVMTRDDIESSARNAALKKYIPYAAGAALLIFLIGGRK